MKYIKLILLFFPFAGFSQTTTVEVYSYTNGIRSVLPTKIIQIENNKTEVYNVQNGIREITPTEVILYDNIQNVIPQFSEIQGVETTTLPPVVEYNCIPVFNLPILPFD